MGIAFLYSRYHNDAIGAPFPVTLLLYPFSLVAQFINVARDVLLYSNIPDFFSSILVGFAGGLLLILISYFAYNYSEQRARKVGILDGRLA